jgi:hypothetical protein
MATDKKITYEDQRLTKAQQKKIKPVKQAGTKNFLGKQEMVTVPKKWLSSSDHVVAELAYITPREQKILIDKNLYGSLKGKPNVGPGGIMSLQGGDAGGLGGDSSSDGKGDGPSERDKQMGALGKTGKEDKSLDSGGPGVDDRSSAAQTAAHNAAVSAAQAYNRAQNAKNRTMFGFQKPPSFLDKIGGGIKNYVTSGGLIGMGIRGLTSLANRVVGPRAVDYNDGYNMANISGPVSRDFGPEDSVGGDNIDSYVSTNQYPIMENTEEEGIATLVNNPDFLQRFRVKNPYRQDKQGQLDPAILEMISKLYT